jgi:hypothetical protein
MRHLAKCNALLWIAFTVMLSGCSDAGTRLSYDVEAGAKRLGMDEGSTVLIEHVPQSWPEGCSGSYDVEIARGAAVADGYGNFQVAPGAGPLIVSCAEGGGGSTTYHLRFVDVPRSLRVHKRAGEVTALELRRQGGKALLVALR